MFEKVNPSHPDKLADRVAGAIVDLAYSKSKTPKIAVEVLIGHGIGTVIAESSVPLSEFEIANIVDRIVGTKLHITLRVVPQDEQLAANQSATIRCGDNGIFRGAPVAAEQRHLTSIAHNIYSRYPSDGKYILDGSKLTICQSCAKSSELRGLYPDAKINPLGDWTGGTDVDTGATNRKLGSDMGDSITGGGLHGKDLSKADVSVNIYAFLKAQELGKVVEISCAIGDEIVDGRPYSEIVNISKQWISSVGGFEQFAEWGFIR